MKDVEKVTLFGKEVDVYFDGGFAFKDFIEDGIDREEKFRKKVEYIYEDAVAWVGDFDEDYDLKLEFEVEVYDEEEDRYLNVVFDEMGDYSYHYYPCMYSKR